MKEKEMGNKLVLVIVFFLLIIYLILSPFSRFIGFVPESALKFITLFDYLLGIGIVIFFFTKKSVLSFRDIYVAIKGSRFAKGFLLMLFIFSLASFFPYLLINGVSISWGALTTLIAGLLLGSFVFYYVKYLNLSLGYSDVQLEREFVNRRKKNFLLFSSMTGMLFIVPGIIFFMNYSAVKIFLLFSILSWIVFIFGIVNYIRFVRLNKK